MKTNLFIPTTLKVGFQSRPDTFNGKLAYIIYYDEKNKLRKESSWTSWRDESLGTLDIPNTPMNGFVFNKGIQRDNYSGWGGGRSVLRVHDPRDFEFEISVDNLIGIMAHSDISKRDIAESCVFAWAGPELVLLPINSQAYRDSVAFTAKQSQKLTSKSLVKGHTYTMKKEEGDFIYMGAMDWFDWTEKDVREDNKQPVYRTQRFCYLALNLRHRNLGKKHIFFHAQKNTFIPISVDRLSSCTYDAVHLDFPKLVDQWTASYHSQPIVGIIQSTNSDDTMPTRSQYVAYIQGQSTQGDITFHYKQENTSWYQEGRPYTFHTAPDGFALDHIHTRSSGCSYSPVHLSTRQTNPSRAKASPILFQLANGMTCPSLF
jgi:hypothetical protein